MHVFDILESNPCMFSSHPSNKINFDNSANYAPGTTGKELLCAIAIFLFKLMVRR